MSLRPTGCPLRTAKSLILQHVTSIHSSRVTGALQVPTEKYYFAFQDGLIVASSYDQNRRSTEASMTVCTTTSISREEKNQFLVQSFVVECTPSQHRGIYGQITKNQSKLHPRWIGTRI